MLSELIGRGDVHGTLNINGPRSAGGVKTMSSSIITLILVLAIFFLILYLVTMLPVAWRVRMIIQIVIIIIGLVYLLQHQSLLKIF
jgi:hypothetical protein